MELDSKILAYRFVAYSALSFSAVAVLSVCITLPMVHNYMSQAKKNINRDVFYCKPGRLPGPPDRYNFLLTVALNKRYS
uniref:Col_cuticle_N domain-containing protein n=1 Tax=Heterorhabditis bacteriophora TaxID=37862 RepID=A0A1I7WB75_HETBA